MMSARWRHTVAQLAVGTSVLMGTGGGYDLQRAASCRAEWTPPRALTTGPRRFVVVTGPAIVPLGRRVALLGLAAELSEDREISSAPAFSGVVLGQSGETTLVPRPPGTGLPVTSAAFAGGPGEAHVLWGTAGDSAARAGGASPDSLWYARFDGRRWSAPELVFVNTDPRSPLEWNRTSEPATTLGDTSIIVAIPTRHAVYVAARRAQGWVQSSLPVGSFYTSLTVNAHGAILMALAPAYFAHARWDLTSVYLSRSVDGGATWTEPRAIFRPTNPAAGTPADLHLFAHDTVLYVIWTQGRRAATPDSVFLMTSSDDGETWRRLPTMSAPGGISGLRALLDHRNAIWIVGTTALGGGDLVLGVWTGARWLTVASPVRSSVIRPALGLVPPDSLYLTWTTFREAKGRAPPPGLPGVPVTMITTSGGCR